MAWGLLRGLLDGVGPDKALGEVELVLQPDLELVDRVVHLDFEVVCPEPACIGVVDFKHYAGGLLVWQWQNCLDHSSPPFVRLLASSRETIRGYIRPPRLGKGRGRGR